MNLEEKKRENRQVGWKKKGSVEYNNVVLVAIINIAG